VEIPQTISGISVKSIQRQKESILSKKKPLEKLQDSETDIVMDMLEELSEKY
jgi:hypothetical protein